MHRAQCLVTVLVVLLLIAGDAAAQNSKSRKPVRNPDRDRWLREHRDEQRKDAARERNARAAMKRWDREHDRRPMSVKHQNPATVSQKSRKKSSTKRTASKQAKRSAKDKQQHAAARQSSKLLAAR